MHGRFDQAFPALTDAEIARIRRFGSVRRFADGEPLFEAGKPRLGMHVLLSGHVAITARDGFGRVTPVVEEGPGQFLAELATLADDAEAEGRGVWYWASPFEAKLCAGREVIVVGGANSAGQAAVFLAGHAAKVRMMIRGPAVAESMSRYLVERIAATDNIEVMTETELVALEGSAELGLERVGSAIGEGAQVVAALHSFLDAEAHA